MSHKSCSGKHSPFQQLRNLHLVKCFYLTSLLNSGTASQQIDLARLHVEIAWQFSRPMRGDGTKDYFGNLRQPEAGLGVCL